jgi:predicted HAD superfamily hydrolase
MPGCEELLTQLKQQGKTVIAVSDMYYRREHLLRIFSALGMNAYFDHVFVSSEDGIAKHSGRLFSQVLRTVDTTPDKIIHIGDVLHSDVRCPLQVGMKALWFYSPQEQNRRRTLKKQQQNDRLTADAMKSADKPVFSKQTHCESATEPDVLTQFYGMGRDYFGPSFCAFTLHLLDSVIRDEMDTVYFLARDGDIFIKLYDLLKNSIRRYQGLPVPPARYLYVSRRSTTLAACVDFGSREYEIAFLNPDDCGPYTLLRKLGLAEEAFSDLIERYFPGKKDGLSKNAQTKKRFLQLFEDADFLRRVETERKTAVDLLKRYLDQEDFWGISKRNALVDIGWNATVQVNLTHAFAAEPGFSTIQGYYYGRDYLALNDYTLSPKSRYGAGFAYDDIRSQPIAYLMPLFEYASCGPHGSTTGYRQTDSGRVEPVLDARYRHHPQQAAIQEGILAYAQEFAKSYDHFEPDVEALRDAAAGRLKQLALYPSREQIKALRSVAIDADWGGKGQHKLS